MMCSKHHKFARLNDHEVFCKRCGDVRRAVPPFTYYPYYQPYRWYSPSWTTWTDSTSTTSPTYTISASSSTVG